MDRILLWVTDWDFVSEIIFNNSGIQQCLHVSPLTLFRGGKCEAQKNSSLTVYHQNFNSIHNLMKIILFSANFKIFLGRWHHHQWHSVTSYDIITNYANVFVLRVGTEAVHLICNKYLVECRHIFHWEAGLWLKLPINYLD